MYVGLLYFVVIVIANTLGAISGMGGGVIIKPMFDLIGVHSVAAISFYSAVAVFTMAVVSTARQLRSGRIKNPRLLAWVALGAVIGGWIGNWLLNTLLVNVNNDSIVQLVQITVTIVTLCFALAYTRFSWSGWQLNKVIWFVVCGTLLGIFASFLGIGGGPINVSLLMIMFRMPIKEATTYSIGTILFSQLSKLVAITLSGAALSFDLTMLLYIIPAALIGGIVGTKFGGILSDQRVTMVFQLMILFVITINIYNGVLVFI